MHPDYQAILQTPFGALGIRLSEGKLSAIDFLPAGTDAHAPQDPAAQAACSHIAAYLRNPHAKLDPPVLLKGTAFQQRVWQAIRDVPPGKTITYGELARRLGSGPRAVANACGANPIPLVIPCHRIVGQNGLGGFMGGRTSAALAIKQWLLQHERNRPASA